MTLSEEINGADIAVIAKLVQRAKVTAPDPNLPYPKSKFEIVGVLKGGQLLGEVKQIEVVYFEDHPVGSKFYLTAIDPKDLAWSKPVAVTDLGEEYLTRLMKYPEAGPDRLAFCQEYFEAADPLVAADSFDEFTRAPYADVQAIKGQMHRDKLLEWIQKSSTSTSRRRLYLCMLGVCGTSSDADVLEKMIRSDDRQIRQSLDALSGTYVVLKGESGLPLIEDLFLGNEKAEYTDTYAAIMAIRFLGQETTAVPKPRLCAALRHVLDRPTLADLVIADLARWQDWSVRDRLVTLFKTADERSQWVRVPVVNYLKVCPEPEAQRLIEELRKIDPDAVKRAEFFPLPGARAGANATRGKTEPAGADDSPAGAKPPATKAAPTAEPAPSGEKPNEKSTDSGTAAIKPVSVRSLKPAVAEGDSAALGVDGPASLPTAPRPEHAEVGVWGVLWRAMAAGAGLLLLLIVILRGERRRGLV